ncbi:hypothetical protein EJ08DRAFT_653228 [Tothia fuscella]|uniref:Uncharacterized protein n=1 Tax=Tothia fuscella TaxID=1048955 RepID=A0A9P4NHY0_9PEZI|nr:hypothetical protein EJ08DRAFT_653228 [Tothia fuscella]
MALHAIVLLGSTHFAPEDSTTSNTVDLDIVGTWVVLSAVGAALPLFLGVAPALKTSKARPLVRAWGVLVIIGAVGAFVCLRNSDRSAVRLILVAKTTLEALDKACSNATHAPLRSGEAIPIKTTRLFTKIGGQSLTGKLDIAALVTMGFGVYTCLKKAVFRSSTSIPEPLYPGDESSPRGKDTANWLVHRIEKLGLWMAAIVVAAIVVLHEMFILKGGELPMLEGLKAYEQWNCWAGTGMVVLATIINWSFGQKEVRVTTASLGGGFGADNGGGNLEQGDWKPLDIAEPLPTHIC